MGTDLKEQGIILDKSGNQPKNLANDDDKVQYLCTLHVKWEGNLDATKLLYSFEHLQWYF